MESVAIDISEDLPLEPTEEDFTEALAGGLADGTLIASESDSDSYDNDAEGSSDGTLYVL